MDGGEIGLPQLIAQAVMNHGASIRDVDVTRLAVARESLLAWVKEAHGRLPQEHEQDDGNVADSPDDGWHQLEAVTIDSATSS